ncbi:PI-PLC X domain-containing protein [Iris pallida]|uniref:PI-PLC X domain-containing protein n=1 Tax=Iris pallida TaxID=29817 RepID=A0AAX6DUV8_IRIPA|nr:PI-PLC X domain-containing protein [Iris pallida]
MGIPKNVLLLISVAFLGVATACSNGACRLLDECSTDSDCEAGLWCSSCSQVFSGSRCVRSTITDQFTLLNNSLPFNKYAYLTTHNSYAIEGEPSHTGLPRITFTNQEDTVTQQLNNGVRALMLDTYDFDDDVWLCHSSGGQCLDVTAFEPAIDTLNEIEAFLSANPSEIVTLILEDYVEAPNGLTNVFNASGLLKYWFPLSSMPENGEDWPLVSDMVANNQRLLVFTSMSSKQDTEGIAYQWNYMVENQYGDDGMDAGECFNREESAPLNDTSLPLVLVNYFPSIPVKMTTCEHNSADLVNMLNTCYRAASNRWANFVAVDYYKRSEGGGSFQATDMLNGRLLCGCNDVYACASDSTSGACTPP